MYKFLVIEGTDFYGFPGGGQTQQAMYVVQMFPRRVALVGISTDDTPIGKWVKKRLYDVEIDFFSVLRVAKNYDKPLIPRRLQFFVSLKRFRHRIQAIGLDYMITQSPEALLATSNWNFTSICYWSPGVGNPLRKSRYQWGRLFAGIFDKFLYEALKKVTIILASANEKKINEFIERGKGKIGLHKVIKFPTRVDIKYFKPKKDFSQMVKSEHKPKFFAIGRLSKVKGWELLLDSFHNFIHSYQDAELYFVGDGEDHKEIFQKINTLGLAGLVNVTGNLPKDEVLSKLHQADLVLFGSIGEGWSVAMVEAIACGKSIVSTNVSGASDMIKDGLNGYIVHNRNPQEFAEKMHMALKLKNASQISRKLSEKYSLESLKTDLKRYWISRL